MSAVVAEPSTRLERESRLLRWTLGEALDASRSNDPERMRLALAGLCRVFARVMLACQRDE